MDHLSEDASLIRNSTDSNLKSQSSNSSNSSMNFEMQSPDIHHRLVQSEDGEVELVAERIRFTRSEDKYAPEPNSMSHNSRNIEATSKQSPRELYPEALTKKSTDPLANQREELPWYNSFSGSLLPQCLSPSSSTTSLAANLSPVGTPSSSVSSLEEPKSSVSDRLPLHHAVKSKDPISLRCLLERRNGEIDKKDVFGATALHLASHINESVCVDLLLRYGASPIACDLYNRTPVYHASRSGRAESLACLLQFLREIDKREELERRRMDMQELSADVISELNVSDAVDRSGSPLKSVGSGSINAAFEILKPDDEVSVINSQNNLLRTSRHSHLYTAIHMRNKKGETPLMKAAEYNHVTCVSMLLNACASVNLKEWENEYTALHLAAKKGNEEVVKLLLMAPSIRINVKDKHARRPADLAQNSTIRNLLSSSTNHPLKSWTKDEVAKWIQTIGLGQYGNLFVENDINGHILSTMTQTSLKSELDIKSYGHRKIICDKVKELLNEEKKRKGHSNSKRKKHKRDNSISNAFISIEETKNNCYDENLVNNNNNDIHSVNNVENSCINNEININITNNNNNNNNSGNNLNINNNKNERSSSKDKAGEISGKVQRNFSENYELPPPLEGEVKKLTTIGRGYFGNVYKGEWNGTIVAVKEFHLESFRDKSNEELIEKEIAIHFLQHHPNIVQCFGHYRDKTHHYILMEYMGGGTLHDFLKYRWDDLPLHREKFILQLVNGMNYLHTPRYDPKTKKYKTVLHRDLTPKNVLLTDDLKLKIADFGLARVKKEHMTQAIGYLPFTAPEAFKGGKYTEKADVYSFGMLLYQMWTGYEPHMGKNVLEFANKAANQNFRPNLEGLSVPTFWCDLIRKCWDSDPQKRPSFAEIQKMIVLHNNSVSSPNLYTPYNNNMINNNGNAITNEQYMMEEPKVDNSFSFAPIAPHVTTTSGKSDDTPPAVNDTGRSSPSLNPS